MIKSAQLQLSPPRLFIIMGVSGTGKSTLAKQMADEFGYVFVDADDFHSEQAKKHMAANQPLTDEMRQPWLSSILSHLHSLYQQEKSVVLAYSGLKSAHRDLFRASCFRCHFFCLMGDKAIITKRITQRQGHFFSPDLLDSQLAAMEFPQDDEVDVNIINIDRPFLRVANEINNIVKEIVELENND